MRALQQPEADDWTQVRALARDEDLPLPRVLDGARGGRARLMGLMSAVVSIDAQGSRRELVAHDEIADVLRRLHDAGVALVLCELTGPGWIVSYRAPENAQ